MMAAEHLNPDVIQELRLVMGGEFAALLRTFVVDSEQRIAAIDAALTAADVEALRRAAHSFKGSTSNIGTLGMAELCRQLEELARSGTTAGGAELLALLRVEFDCVQQEISSLAV